MPLDTRQLAANRARLTLSYAGESVTIEYYPAAITETALAEVGQAADSGSQSLLANAAAINAALCRLIASWDVYSELVYRDDGRTVDEARSTPFPITPEALATLPLALRNRLLLAIIEDAQMGEANGTPSSPPSSVTPIRASGGGSRR